MSKQPPTHLCKYLVPALLPDVIQGRVRFTQPLALNDPFELRPIFDAQKSAQRMLDEVVEQSPEAMRRQIVKAYRSAPKRLRKRLSLSTFERMATGAIARADVLGDFRAMAEPVAVRTLETVQDEVARQMQEAVGIFSVTEDPLSPTMWSHYADEHRGLVLEFDSSHPWFHRARSRSDEFYRLRRVNYLDLSETRRTFLETANPLITKGSDWQYEKEWRVLALLQDAIDTVSGPHGPVHLFSLDVSAVRAVVFGLRASQEVIEQGTALIRGTPTWSHVRLRRIVVSRSTTALAIDDITDA